VASDAAGVVNGWHKRQQPGMIGSHTAWRGGTQRYLVASGWD
jgi:hypothetical protein